MHIDHNITCFCRQIAEAEVCLNDYLYYEAFLMKLSPKEWQDEQNAKKKKARVEKLHKPQCMLFLFKHVSENVKYNLYKCAQPNQEI